MPVLQKGSRLHPFWGETINLITGLDPLGLQVTSEATYATMLPGISNLTNRLRYYGFYCWLLDFYFKSEKRINQTEQYRFIRRAELLIAIIMQTEKPHISQITGSDFAANLLKAGDKRVFNLKRGADKDSGEAVYWKFPSGAFGQYYFGAMQAMALAVRYENNDGDVIFNITRPHSRQKVSGQQLAEAFDKNLTNKVKGLFLEAIQSGKLASEDIPRLAKYFSIDGVKPETKEWSLYAEMLMDKDFPAMEMEEQFTFHRQQSIIQLVNNAKENNGEYNWNNFLIDCYGKKFSDNDHTQTGWYCYLLNEYWQYACGIIFCAALSHLHSLHSDQYLPRFIDSFADEILKDFEVADDTRVHKYVTSLQDDVTEESLLEEFAENKKYQPHEDARLGFDLLFYLYKKNRELLPQVKEFMSRNNIIRDGNVADGLIALDNVVHQNIKTFIINFLHKEIICRHQMVALRKMGNGTQSTSKFVIEEQLIRLIDIFPARWTSPRMNALRNLLFDLGIVSAEGEITPLHTKLLSTNGDQAR